MTRQTAKDQSFDSQSFDSQCYALLKKVPKGKLTTYKDLAHALGSTGYRAVGNAMNRNPFAPKVPCHRVVRSDGSIGGFARGTRAKIKMLRDEGIPVKDEKVEDLESYLHRFAKK